MKIRACFISIFVIMTAFLMSCSLEEKETNGPEDHLRTFTYKDQDFDVITYEEEFNDYVEQMEDAEDYSSVYQSTVLDSFRSQAFGEDGGYSLVSAEDWHFAPPENKKSLEKTVDYFEKELPYIIDEIKTGIQDSVYVLPGGDKKIHVLPMNPDNVFGRGTVDDLSGVTWNEEFLLVMVGRNFSAEELKHLIAHEYHHTVYNEMHESDFTLLESSVVEGKAEVFAAMVYPDVQSSATEPLRGGYKEKTSEIFLEYADSTDPIVHGDFLFGFPSEGIPERAMYRIGYQMVNKVVEKIKSL